MFKYIFHSIITILFSCIIGLLIIYVVDKRLSEVKINIPKQKIILNIPKDLNSTSNKDNKSFDITTLSQDEVIENFEPVIENFEPVIEKIQSNFPYKAFDIYNINNLEVDMPKIHEQICIKNPHFNKKESTLYGVTNYKFPCDMNNMEKELFRLKYPKNMTLQDYVNWLWFNSDNISKFSYNDLKNFEKIKHNKHITYSDMKLADCSDSSEYNIDKYFNNIYSSLDPSKQIEDYPIPGYNNDDYR